MPWGFSVQILRIDRTSLASPARVGKTLESEWFERSAKGCLVMARYENETFLNAQIRIDGNQFFNCRFDQCTIEYRGEQLLQLQGCHFVGCRWFFNGPAGETLRFLGALYADGDAGLKKMVEETLANITTNVVPELQPKERRTKAV